MARSKSYNRNEAIERACHAFWEQGYSALGVRELEKLSGLNKFAIRIEFGGKEGLFLEVLELYIQSAKETVLAPMRSGGIEAIEAFFKGLVTEGSENSSPWGCLVVNTGIENAELQRPALRAASDAYWTMLKEHFEQALRRSMQAGTVVATLNVREACHGLVTAVMGIQTQNRVSGAQDAGASLVTLVLNLIASWRV